MTKSLLRSLLSGRWCCRLPAALLLLSVLSAQGELVELRARPLAPSLDRLETVHDGTALADPRWVVWACYPQDRGAFADHQQYLADLQRRFREQRVRIAVVLPSEAAARVAAAKPAFTVAAGEAGAAATVWLGEAGAPQNALPVPLDRLLDPLQAAVDGSFDPAKVAEASELSTSLLDSVGDGGNQLRDGVQHCVRVGPRNGTAHALAVLHEWWCTGDLAAARRAAQAGLQALAGESVPLVVFADLVLRGDRTDRELARSLAVALAPAAAGAPAGPMTQLVYLRALLRAGQDRLAGRVAATLPKLLDGDATLLLLFAETLMEGGEPQVFRDQAERAVAAASLPGTDARWLFGARHKLLVRCGAEAAAVDALLAEYRALEAHRNYGLNNDAWYMIVQPETMGRFDTMALAHGEEMLRAEGAALDAGNKDTVALAMYVNGRLEQAVELQTAAVAARGRDPRYVGRLSRFEAALAEQRARDGAKK